MNEKPILFKGEMVRAILAGNKTQTRRVIKPQPKIEIGGHHFVIGPVNGDTYDPELVTCTYKHLWTTEGIKAFASYMVELFSPYGQVGDRLWVRESFAKVPSTAYRLSEGVHQKVNPTDTYWSAVYAENWTLSPIRMSPSIHMPRWASRINLEITNIRIEKVQQISEQDVWKEGIVRPDWWDNMDPWHDSEDEAGEMFAELWDSINGKTYPWKSNPWVWVVEFTQVVND
jgi:hypothetical protein